ncbi:MAG: pyruvate ferredoxin oxidoreductase, partial [Woeseiaceae bacterium]|nr:pyruvate ferredoxin oxidoreductase [Woeseiaceae bacterium]
DAMIARRREFLVDYQGEPLAARYSLLVEKTRTAVSGLRGGEGLTGAVARSYFRLLSYKDEYEVARLHTQRAFLDSIRRDFGEHAKMRFHLAPPFLNAGRDARGRPRKKEFGAWILPLFRLLARMRGLRGTAFDPFGMSAERRMERALITEFEQRLDTLLCALRPGNLDQAIEIVARYLDIRGYGPVKEAAITVVRADVESRLQALLNTAEEAA